MAITLADQLKKFGPTALPFNEWRQEATKIRFYGMTNDEILDILGYPVNPDGSPIKFTYKGDKSGFDYRTGNREKQANSRNQNAAVQTSGEDVYNKGVVAPAGSGLEEHHRRVMSVYAPFFEGLNPEEQKELAEWFVTEGAPLGNVKENLMALPPDQHAKVHSWLKENYIQSKTGKPLINLKNLSLNERFVPALTYLEHIQPAIDQQTANITAAADSQELGIANRKPFHPQFQGQFQVGLSGAIELGMRKLNTAQNALDTFMFAADQNNIDQVNSFADQVSSGAIKMRPDPKTDLGKRAGDAIVNSVNGVTDVIKQALPTSNVGTPRSNGRNRTTRSL